MRCTSPLTAWQPLAGGQLKFTKNPAHADRKLLVPCGQCMDCRLNKSEQWAVRCVHEAQQHKHNCFITLTYDDKHLPEHGTLYKPDLQKFFKRLRDHKGKFRYYACGEYGDNTDRAHYHACIFGLDFEDKKQFRKIGEHTLYISKQLNDIWGNGNTSIGELTFQTAAYTARYVTKKTFGKGLQRYVRLDEETGELSALVQPFAVMSLRSAIAKQWLTAYHSDLYANGKDHIVIKGRKIKPPKYYDKIYDTINPAAMEKIKEARQENHTPETEQTRRARATITHARIVSRKQI